MDPLAYVFSAANAARRNLKDFASDPLALIERQVDALRNTTRGQEAVVNDQGAGMREIPREEQIRRMTEGATDTLSGGLGVIKPKGGNWLSGRYGVEKQLEHLRKPDAPYPNRNEQGFSIAAEYGGTPIPEAEMSALRAEPHWARNRAVNAFIERQLTKYIKNDMASPTDPIRLMLEKFPEEKAAKLAAAEAKVKALRQKQEAQAATRGVPPEMLTRTRQDVLAAEEARDLIAENTGLHIGADELNRYNPEFVLNMREKLGMPVKAIGATPEARKWENYADTQIIARPASEFQAPGNLEADPWLAKVDPNTLIYAPSHNPGQVFHLVDELRNSLAEGRLTPEQVQKMPIDQAVRHVAEINALRAVEAKNARAMDMADMPIYKDYPEQGMSWRQLKSDDEGKLEKWLKQEGDAMGHCVGGYCEDVASGQSNIYSLRDAKGNPYVTIETLSPTQGPSDWYYNADDLPESFYTQYPEPDASAYSDDLSKWREAAKQWRNAIAASPEYQRYLQGPSSINQIKGRSNESPDPKYFPLIQDFIRSSQWSAIEDAQNAGLTPAQVQELLKGSQ